MLDKIKGVIKTFNQMSLEDIRAYKIVCIVLVVADLFGIYWYLGLKKLGIALLMVVIAFLAVFLYLEREKSPDEPRDTSHSKPSPKFHEIMPSSDDYNKRLRQAVGSEIQV